MKLSKYLLKHRIIDLKSDNFHDAVVELINACNITSDHTRIASLAQEIITKEENITSYLGKGISLPYVKCDIDKPYVFAVGRCLNGISANNNPDNKEIKIIFLMIVSNNSEDTYLSVLAAIARIFQNIADIDTLLSLSIAKFREEFKLLFGSSKTQKISKKNTTNSSMFREAKKIANSAKCNHILVFGDVVSDNTLLPVNSDDNSTKISMSLVSCASNLIDSTDKNAFQYTINVHFCSNYRLSQVRSAVIIGLTRGIFQPKDKICCLTGLANSNTFDTISIVDVAKEFGNSFATNDDLLKEGIHPEVLERLLTIAADISIEGREGKSVGCLFILGDINKIKPYTKPLVLNPFYGYKEEDRNILNPFMAETVKEFSSIDGAFIVRGDGVIESAGSLVQATNDPSIQIPSGFGTRHAAAATISSVANCIAIVVSESTNLVTIFNDGKMMLFSDQSFSSAGL